MSSNRRSQDEPFSGINVTPLTDVMLVLLITFLLTATSFESQSLKVPLPQVRERQEVENHATVLEVTAEGKVVWPDSSYQGTETEEALTRLHGESEYDVLAFAVDRNAEYGALFPLMKTASTAGWSEIILLTEEFDEQ